MDLLKTITIKKDEGNENNIKNKELIETRELKEEPVAPMLPEIKDENSEVNYVKVYNAMHHKDTKKENLQRKHVDLVYKLMKFFNKELYDNQFTEKQMLQFAYLHDICKYKDEDDWMKNFSNTNDIISKDNINKLFTIVKEVKQLKNSHSYHAALFAIDKLHINDELIINAIYNHSFLSEEIIKEADRKVIDFITLSMISDKVSKSIVRIQENKKIKFNLKNLLFKRVNNKKELVEQIKSQWNNVITLSLIQQYTDSYDKGNSKVSIIPALISLGINNLDFKTLPEDIRNNILFSYAGKNKVK